MQFQSSAFNYSNFQHNRVLLVALCNCGLQVAFPWNFPSPSPRLEAHALVQEGTVSSGAYLFQAAQKMPLLSLATWFDIFQQMRMLLVALKKLVYLQNLSPSK
eukprot:scaffold297113_cov15-Tisochrysis_lutea.AAC.1